MTEFLMPSLGADMQSGTLVEWQKKPGDPMKRGDIIAVVETQKGAIEIEVFEDGIFEACLVEVGTTVPVGSPLASIKMDKEKTKPAAQEPPHMPAATETVRAHEPTAVAPVTLNNSEGRIRISPAARKLAEKHKIDLTSLSKTGSSSANAITLADVEAEISCIPESHSINMTGMREAIAAAMSRSKQEIPHYYLAHTIDLSNAIDFLHHTNTNKSPAERLLPGALYLKAVARAIQKFPEFNGHFSNGHFQQAVSAHIGIAINIRGGGLVAPAILDVDKTSLDSVMSSMRDLVSRVRAGRFRASELTCSTLTISSLGDRGVETLYGVIYPPQVAIVGFGTPSLRPWVNDGKLQTRQLVNITLAADHRVSDGHRGALFLKEIDRYLQEPEKL